MRSISNLERAKEYLSCREELKCVLWKGDTHYISEKRGVAPMLDFLEQKLDLNGFSAADRVVGKATAWLFVLAGVSSVYGAVMSEGARDILLRHGIECQANRFVPYIINRRGDGACPMETAVRGIEDPFEAYVAIQKALQSLSKT